MDGEDTVDLEVGAVPVRGDDVDIGHGGQCSGHLSGHPPLL